VQRVLPWRSVEEVTFECSPTTITSEKLQAMRDAGVTRLSMGVQQLNDDILKKNGRVHLVSDVERAYEMIAKVGFDVVNLDLIVGLVGESNTTFMESLDQMIEMNPDSVTIYQLEIPKNTPLYHLYHNEKLEDSPASWQVKRTRLQQGFRRLERSGYQLRSAYTAARSEQGRRFLYQDSQYQGADLIGIGASSFSYFRGAHYQNLTSLKSYLEQVQAGRLPIERAYFLNREERLVRELVLQLKLGSVTRGYFQEKFNTDIFERFSEAIANFEPRGLLYRNGEKLSLTREGLLQADHILSAFYLPEHQEVRYS
ncbi:MAG: coproporphyrinogen-III oxidase family protein, partial [Candidatus Poribacteria bacterium]